MYCVKCGKEVSKKDLFCSCGERITDYKYVNTNEEYLDEVINVYENLGYRVIEVKKLIDKPEYKYVSIGKKLASIKFNNPKKYSETLTVTFEPLNVRDDNLYEYDYKDIYNTRLEALNRKGHSVIGFMIVCISLWLNGWLAYGFFRNNFSLGVNIFFHIIGFTLLFARIIYIIKNNRKLETEQNEIIKDCKTKINNLLIECNSL